MDVPGATVNRLCGSGLQAVVDGARAIANGEADLIVAGGVESMSRAPLVMPKAREGFPRGDVTAHDTTLGWRFINPRLQKLWGTDAAGRDRREGRRALQGHPRGPGRLRPGQPAALGGRAGGGQVRGRARAGGGPGAARGRPAQVEVDEHPRPDTTAADLAKLRPVFRARTARSPPATPRASTTAPPPCCWRPRRACAAWASPTPLARYVGAAAAGVEPSYMGIGPVPATRKLLGRLDVRAGELDLIELNEAFAAQALPCIAELGLDPERVNVNGGAIALGHPLGCSGARLLVTLAHELSRRGARRGLATMCIGVGQGISALIER